MSHAATKPATAKPARQATRKPVKTYIDVAYKDRDLAKRLGARWDASVKRWYCPSDSTLALIYKWRKASVPSPVSATAKAPAQTVSRNVTRITPPGTTSRLPSNAAFDFGDTLELPLAS